MKTIKEAADSLLKKGSITKDECDGIKTAAGLFDVTKTVETRPGILGKATPWVAGAGLTLLAASTLEQLLRPLVDKVKSTMSYNQLIEKNPVLADKDPKLIKDYFGVINTFSPKAASNPLVAGALVNKMIEFGGVDHKLVQDIASIQAGVESSDIIKDIASSAASATMGAEEKVKESTNIPGTANWIP